VGSSSPGSSSNKARSSLTPGPAPARRSWRAVAHRGRDGRCRACP
jgi:hypothetical protein